MDSKSMDSKSMDSKLNWLPVFCLLLFLGGCTWPRIIILEDPLTPEEHLNLGVAYEKNNEFDHAVTEYQSAAQKLPIAYLYLGNVYFQRKEFNKSEKYYKKAIQKVPGQADAYNNLAWLYYVKGKTLDKAENLVLKAMELRPDRVSVYMDTLNKIRELKQIGRQLGDERGSPPGNQRRSIPLF